MYHMAGSGIRTYETRRTFGSCWIALAFALAAMLTIGSTTPAAVIYVDGASGDDANLGTTWAQAFRTVQKALSVTDPGDEIWIAEGVYRPDEGPGMTAGDRSATFLIDGSQLGVAIYGGFEHGDTSVQDRNLDDHPTVLTGDLLGDDLPAFGLRSDNSANVVTARDVDFTAALDTLIIEAGNAKLAAMLIFDGGGIRCESASGGSLPGSPTIRHCHVRDCEARADGGGIWIGQDVSSLIFDTRISGCRAGFEGSIPSSGSGGGLRSLRSYANLVRSSVNDCTAAGPGGGASYFVAPSEFNKFSIVNCTFADNSGVTRGGALDVDGLPDLSSGFEMNNCLFISNVVLPATPGDIARGGGVSILDASARITNCTFVENRAGAGGGIALKSINPDMRCDIFNTILMSNEVDPFDGTGDGDQVRVSVAPPVVGLVELDHCLVDGLLEGLGGPFNPVLYFGASNVDGPAGFVDQPSRDDRLAEVSVAIDAGSTVDVDPDSFDVDEDGDLLEATPDLDHRRRIVAGTVDLGAFEFACSTDLDDTGVVDVQDLLVLLAAWGHCPAPPADCAADLDANGAVDTVDLLALLADWGCGEPGVTGPPTSVVDCLVDYTDPDEQAACIEAMIRAGTP